MIKTDMELAFVYDIPTNFHSRTRLAVFSHLPGGETTATMRLQCDKPTFKGNVQYPPTWMEWTIKVLNRGNKQAENYLFRKAGGIQNSATKGRMEQVACEGNLVSVIKHDRGKRFLYTFHTDEKPPTYRDVTDPRINKITVVNKLDQLTRSTAFDVFFPLMGRPGEELWLDQIYLKPLQVIPQEPVPFVSLTLTVNA